MTDLITAEEAQKLLDRADGADTSGSVARSIEAFSHAAPRLARTVIALHADTEAAVALAVARAARGVSDLTHWIGDDDHGTTLVALQDALTAIRAIAPEDAIAEVERMRAERDAALADVARFQEERTYVIGVNDGWDAAVEQGEASPAVEKAMVRFWKKLAETHNERADRLAAELAANAREAGLAEKLAAARETFCYASPGSDEEFTSLLLGFDTAASIIRAALAQPGTEGGE